MVVTNARTVLGKVALGVLLVVFSTTSCGLGEPLIPESVHEFVADDDRMRTYDLAWQEIRALNDHIDRDITEGLVTESLVVIARMHRLETGSPGRLRNRAAASAVERAVSEAVLRDRTANLVALQEAALDLQDSFDEGSFSAAKESGLVVYALATHLYPAP